MEKHRDITLRRINKFKGALRSRLYSEIIPANISVFSPEDNSDHNRMSFDQAVKGEFVPAEVGMKLGPKWSTHWFKVQLDIPTNWSNQIIHLLWNTNSEACVFGEDGAILQGLSHDHRQEFPLICTAGSQVTLYVEVACNTLFGIVSPPDYLGLKDHSDIGTLSRAEFGLFNNDFWPLYNDYLLIADMAHELPADNSRGAQALWIANSIINDFATFPAGKLPENITDYFTEAKHFLSQKAGEGTFKLAAIGNAHTDTAWLWPVAETRRKVYRTMSSALRYMDEYPEYKFAWSQALYWEWAEENHPAHFAEMKEKVASGQLLPTGGSWIEPDCNIPSGESLIRQFLYGQRYYKHKLDFDCEIFWQPDVFGYSAQLPQIMKGVGLSYFLTQKMSWNQINKMPHHSMIWRGLDGSEVLTHFPPADCYEAPCTVKSVEYTRKNYKDHDRTDEAIYLYGHGDGGGGPTREMLESIRRMNNLDGMPKVEQSAPIDFFKRLEKKSDKLCKWVGELYLELHRGTYTSQAKNKLYNRRAEELLRDIEMIYATALPARYPRPALERLWKVVLLNQFHDIIPGSSIQEAHEVSRREMEQALAELEEIRAKAVSELSPKSGSHLKAINTLGKARTEVVECPTEMSAHGLAIVSAPACGYAVVDTSSTCETETVSVAKDNQNFVLENPQIKATINPNGRLISLIDKSTKRQVISPDQLANNLVIFEDEPLYWDAWDVDVYHLETTPEAAQVTSIEICEENPLRASLEINYTMGCKSSLKQRISLTAIAQRLDFECEVDWQETNKLLKVEFPVDVMSQEATYEIQFGQVKRPTHFNTSWDMARFEVCAQRWADLSESDYGVALLNDSKYGYSIHDNVISLSLLRSPKRPDPTCDMGAHTFKYALYPHQGTPQQADVVGEAARFNIPMLLAPTAEAERLESWFTVNNEHIVIDTIKFAEDSDEIIVRLYEANGSRGHATLECTLPHTKIALCDMLEKETTILKDNTLYFKPFEIKTIKFTTN